MRIRLTAAAALLAVAGAASADGNSGSRWQVEITNVKNNMHYYYYVTAPYRHVSTHWAPSSGKILSDLTFHISKSEKRHCVQKL